MRDFRWVGRGSGCWGQGWEPWGLSLRPTVPCLEQVSSNSYVEEQQQLKER